MIAAGLFWTAAATLAYTYVGFPLIAIARAVARPRPIQAAAVAPSVTFIIAAHNEAPVIARKLENLLHIDYDAELVEIIVASDGSTDGTEEIDDWAEVVRRRKQLTLAGHPTGQYGDPFDYSSGLCEIKYP